MFCFTGAFCFLNWSCPEKGGRTRISNAPRSMSCNKDRKRTKMATSPPKLAKLGTSAVNYKHELKLNTKIIQHKTRSVFFPFFRSFFGTKYLAPGIRHAHAVFSKVVPSLWTLWLRCWKNNHIFALKHMLQTWLIFQTFFRIWIRWFVILIYFPQ